MLRIITKSPLMLTVSPLMLLLLSPVNIHAVERQIQTMSGSSLTSFQYTGLFNSSDADSASKIHQDAAKTEAINACSLGIMGISAKSSKELRDIYEKSDDYFSEKLVKSTSLSSVKVVKNEVSLNKNGKIIIDVTVSCEGSYNFIDLPANSVSNLDKTSKKLAQCLRQLAQEPKEQWQKLNYLQRFVSVLRLSQDRDKINFALQKCEQTRTIPGGVEGDRELFYLKALNEIKNSKVTRVTKSELKIIEELNSGLFSCTMHSFFAKAGLIATVGVRVGSLYCYLLDGKQVIGTSIGVEGGLGIGAVLGHEWKLINRTSALKSEIVNIKENHAYNDHSLNTIESKFSKGSVSTSGPENMMTMTSLGLFNIFLNDGPTSWGMGLGLGLFYTGEANANLAFMPIGTDWDYLINMLLEWTRHE